MSKKFTVSLESVMKEFSLQTLFMPDDPRRILISSKEVIRPGLELTGFFDYFDNTRLLVVGNTEVSFLLRFPEEKRFQIMDDLFSKNSPALIVTRNRETCPSRLETAKNNNIPVLRTSEMTSTFIANLVTICL